MIDVEEKKAKIISFLKMAGPSLPVRIAKTIEMDPIFSSAILSELLNTKKVITSNMKIGASPLYFFPGDEEKLENHIDNLKTIEREAYIKLKKNKFLIDENQGPQLRVALRSIKDFAIPFKFKEKIMWKYAFTPDEEIEVLLKSKEGKKESQKKQERKDKQTTQGKAGSFSDKTGGSGHAKHRQTQRDEGTLKTSKEDKKIRNIFEEKKSPELETEFLEEVKKYLNKKEIKLIRQIQVDKKEVVAIIKLKTQIGSINFLLIAKNKKTTNKDEIKSAIQRSNHEKMPCLFLIKDKPKKTILNFIEDYQNFIKIDSL